MTIEYFDGFEDYNTSQMSRYFTSIIGTEPSISAGNGRNGGSSYRHTSAANNGRYSSKTLPSSASTRTVGFAYKASSIGNTFILFSFLDSNSVQVDLRLTATGTLKVTRAGTSLGETTFTLSGATYYSIELSVVIHPTAGSFELRINQVNKLSATGINTRATSNSTSNGFALGDFSTGGSGPSTSDYDDFYITDDGTFLGDCRVETDLATGDGASSQFSRSTGSANYTQIDDNPANDDTDYNFAGTSGLIDLYTYPNLATGAGNVKAVMIVPVVKSDNAGLVTEQAVYRSGGTNYLGASNNIGSSTYQALPDIKETDPDTSTAWTISGVNAAQLGLKRVA
jgi:hypothetical protein